MCNSRLSRRRSRGKPVGLLPSLLAPRRNECAERLLRQSEMWWESHPCSRNESVDPNQTYTCDICSVLKVFHRRTGAEEVPVAVNIVDPGDGGPEFVFARPGCGKGCLLACVGTVPIFGCD